MNRITIIPPAAASSSPRQRLLVSRRISLPRYTFGDEACTLIVLAYVADPHLGPAEPPARPARSLRQGRRRTRRSGYRWARPRCVIR